MADAIKGPAIPRKGLPRPSGRGTPRVGPARIAYFQRAALSWYQEKGRRLPWRRASCSRYGHVIAEVLLQRTRAEVVEKFFPKFLAKYPSWGALARAREEDLGEFLTPIGLWRRRADTLRRLARAVRALRGGIPRERTEIEALPGVGQYIANAIELLCYERPRPLLDVNMARVLERFFGPRKLADIRFDPYLQGLACAVVDCEDPKGLNWAILDLATLVCRAKKPLHAECPLRARCKYARYAQVTQTTDSDACPASERKGTGS